MFQKLKSNVTNFDSDDLLASLGLERRQTTAEQLLPALALVGAGVLVGVGLGLMFAPKSGADLRGDLRSQVKRLEERVRKEGADALDGAGERNA